MKMSHKDKVEWRKNQIQQLLAKGHYSHREIAGILQIPKSTVSKDILTLIEEAKNSIRKYIDERLPEEYERILVGVTSILREAWERGTTCGCCSLISI
jgi:predicted ArsR family transcriptional regulator